MSDGRKYYCICDSNCKFETMTKEQIYAAIDEACGNVPTGDYDAFVTKIKELNANGALSFWLGTEAEYNALGVNAAEYTIHINADGKAYFTPKDVDAIARYIDNRLSYKQNSLGWVTNEDIDAMFDGTYKGEEDESAEGVMRADISLKDSATGVEYRLYVNNSSLRMEEA